MGLHEELKELDLSGMADTLAETAKNQLRVADKHLPEEPLQDGYATLHAGVGMVRIVAETGYGFSPRESDLIAGGVALAFEWLKNYAEQPARSATPTTTNI